MLNASLLFSHSLFSMVTLLGGDLFIKLSGLLILNCFLFCVLDVNCWWPHFSELSSVLWFWCLLCVGLLF